MLYKSTRGGHDGISSALAIKTGIAPDGGLYVPSTDIHLKKKDIANFKTMNYTERAIAILSPFLDDYSADDLSECVNKSYNTSRFDHKDIAPAIKLSDNLYMLELWHGPTCAFKDMALQIMPHLMVKALAKTGEQGELVILVATSGDTGKAALEGFKDVPGIRIIVYFPKNGVSEMQRLQMITQEGSNVHAIAVEGNFDDTQNGVKAIFSDSSLIKDMNAAGYRTSSANSINWGRLVPQIVYYFSAYADLLANNEIQSGSKINFVVPTGNFGNILAAWYAYKMGLPINRLICASNENNVLTDFINTGVYTRLRDFKKTSSPSMDILISSNLERLLFNLSGRDSTSVNKWMKKLKEDGIYEVGSEVRNSLSTLFSAGYSNEADVSETIRSVYKDYGYLVDTHTAVGIDVYDKYVISTGDLTKTVVVSTASPFKFNESVAKAVFGENAVKGKNEFELLSLLSRNTNLPVPVGLSNLDSKEIRHHRVCGISGMKHELMEILGI